MYRKFYSLTRNPFEVSPDPYFFYPTPSHNEALALLNYGVLRRKGFVVVTGEVGTGKTLLLRCLLDSLALQKVASAYIYNPILSVKSFLEQVLTDLGLSAAARSKSEALSRLNDYLMARSLDDLTTALVVDEAQLLSWDLLEEIRLLTNLETTQHKLLQIVLVGQPELDGKLDSHQLRQLKQRVALRCNLLLLDLQQVEGYIHRRLELAGANRNENVIFSKEAIETIYRISKGIPRLVNTLCENCLVLGYGLELNQITPAIVREVASDFRLDQSAAGGESRNEGKEIQSRTEVKDIQGRTEVKEIQGRTDRVPARSPSTESNIPTLSDFLTPGATGLALKAPEKAKHGVEAQKTVEATQTAETSKSAREPEKTESLSDSDNADSLEGPRAGWSFLRQTKSEGLSRSAVTAIGKNTFLPRVKPE
jgi:general secretion pathway protein A